MHRNFHGMALALVLPLTGMAASDTPPVSLDFRFSGFDAISHIQRNHPSLSQQAEAISHWAGYYNVNPILLTHIVKARPRPVGITSASIKSMAANLAERASSQPGQQFLDSAMLAGTRAEMAAAGLRESLMVATDTPPALDLPFTLPQAWLFNGVHTWTGDDEGNPPMSSIDMTRMWTSQWGIDTSGDWVTAASDGEVTVFSSCYVQVLHDSGWATRYYHLDNVQVTNGQQVRAGDRLANYANEEEQALCSGGHSQGPHLHFGLLKDNQYHSLQDIALSGYVIHPGEFSYDRSRDTMWLDKRGVRYFVSGTPITQESGDNTIDYRYNGMWYSADSNGHGINFEITEIARDGGPRKVIFVVMYTYDDEGAANFYVGNLDFERWRSDESKVIDLLQTAGGNFSDLDPVDFDDPSEVSPAGQIEVRILDCKNARVVLNLAERSTGQQVEHEIDLVKLIGNPDHVCDAASLPLED